MAVPFPCDSTPLAVRRRGLLPLAAPPDRVAGHVLGVWGYAMRDLDWAFDGRTALRGFTAHDWTQLQDAYRNGAGRGRWRHAEVATNDFSQYLALWYDAPAGREPPNLAVVRFDQTGTYALLAGEAFVATGASLQEILPALSAARPDFPDEEELVYDED